MRKLIFLFILDVGRGDKGRDVTFKAPGASSGGNGRAVSLNLNEGKDLRVQRCQT